MDPPCPAMDRPVLECSRRPGCSDCTTESAAEGCAGASEGNGGGAPAFSSSSSSSLEGGSVNGNGDRGGVGGGRRRQPRGKKRGGERCGFWAAMRQESVWFERGVYERAESAYQAWLAERSPAPPAPSPSPPPPARPAECRHGDLVACHHLVASVWVNQSAFESAERRFMEQAPPPAPAAPSSLAIVAPPDEGYLSLTPTPPTPAHRPSINGLPGPPPDLLRGVWVEKPRYDRAEASYYHSLCAPGPGPQPGDAPRPPSPAAGGAAAGREVALCFLHALSEPAWLEAPRFHAAERRFHERRAEETTVGGHAADLPPSESDPPAPSMPCSEYGSSG